MVSEKGFIRSRSKDHPRSDNGQSARLSSELRRVSTGTGAILSDAMPPGGNRPHKLVRVDRHHPSQPKFAGVF
jgi:hypothetical protein